FFFPSKNIFVLFLIFLVLTYLIFKLVIFYKKKKIILITSLTAIILGAFSNLFERFIYGYVTDYISFLSLGVFNLSDVLIAFGVILLLYIKIKKG
ncbi:signal peptidase II, partial [bacterium]|nr:signal peptidase II [bacterium]